jgi:predicted transcriptional regulator
MARQSTGLPTDGELRILQVLWSRGPSSVREVHEALAERQETGYTTVLKLMQIMTEKGTIRVDRSVRPQVYRTVEPRNRTQRRLVKHLLDRAFSGSPGNLVLQALSTKSATPEERRQIRELLDRLEEESA